MQTLVKSTRSCHFNALQILRKHENFSTYYAVFLVKKRLHNGQEICLLKRVG